MRSNGDLSYDMAPTNRTKRTGVAVRLRRADTTSGLRPYSRDPAASLPLLASEHMMVAPYRWPHVALLSILLVQACAAGAGQTTPPTPGVRNGHSLFYDRVRGEVILFGGADHTQVRGDTWSWQGSAWRCLVEAGPPPRTFAASAYDPLTETEYLFGGNRVLFGTDTSANTFLADLWTWHRGRWTSHPESGPAARAEAVMAFDPRRRKLVLFGGYSTTDGRQTRFGDTWEWDGRGWSQVSQTGPTPRNGSTMVFYPPRGVSILFGGSDGVASGETWSWDGRTWTRDSALTSEPRYNTVMWYDPVTEHLFRFGGWYDRRRWDDTWEYDGLRWSRLTVRGPSPRNHAAVTYDDRRRVAVLIGGHDGDHVLGDVWEWHGGKWSKALAVPPMLRVNNGH